METTYNTDIFRNVKRKKYHRFENLYTPDAEFTSPSRSLKRVNSEVGRSRTRIIIRARLFRFLQGVCVSCVAMSQCVPETRSRASASVAAGIHRNARDRVCRKTAQQQRQEADQKTFQDYLARSVEDGRYAFYIPGNLAYLDLV